MASWEVEDLSTAPALRLGWPGLLGMFDLDGLFTVHSDCLSSRTGFHSQVVLKVGGELVGTPSDPS